MNWHQFTTERWSAAWTMDRAYAERWSVCHVSQREYRKAQREFRRLYPVEYWRGHYRDADAGEGA